jgi:hypothetical protein
VPDVREVNKSKSICILDRYSGAGGHGGGHGNGTGCAGLTVIDYAAQMLYVLRGSFEACAYNDPWLCMPQYATAVPQLVPKCQETRVDQKLRACPFVPIQS